MSENRMKWIDLEIRKLDKMYDAGLISDAEYGRKIDEIMEGVWN